MAYYSWFSLGASAAGAASPDSLFHEGCTGCAIGGAIGREAAASAPGGGACIGGPAGAG